MTAWDPPLHFQRLRRSRAIFVGVNDPENTSLREIANPRKKNPSILQDEISGRERKSFSVGSSDLRNVVSVKVNRIERRNWIRVSEVYV